MILWDPFGVCGVEAVPDVTAVDEYGVVRIDRPSPKAFQEQFVEGFLGRRFEAPGRTHPGPLPSGSASWRGSVESSPWRSERDGRWRG